MKHQNKAIQHCLQSRLRIGTNAVTRALDAATHQRGVRPMLVIMVQELQGTDPTMLVHVPVYCHKLQVPLLVLPAYSRSNNMMQDDAMSSAMTTSHELGKLLLSHGHNKQANVLCFLPHAGTFGAPVDVSQMHAAVDSFVRYVQGKISTA